MPMPISTQQRIDLDNTIGLYQSLLYVPGIELGPLPQDMITRATQSSKKYDHVVTIMSDNMLRAMESYLNINFMACTDSTFKFSFNLPPASLAHNANLKAIVAKLLAFT